MSGERNENDVVKVPSWIDPFPSEDRACGCDASVPTHATLGDLVQIDQRGSKRCRWRAAVVDSSAQSVLGAAVCVVTDGIMRWRCRGALSSYVLWRSAVLRGLPLAGADGDRVLPFIQPIFGVPGAEKPEEHLRGWIAEYIWFRLVSEHPVPAERSLRRVEGPSFHATEPGGDGLAVWETLHASDFQFCLWEIKNYTGAGGLSPTVRGAYTQIGERALEYLAKLTSVEAAAGDPELGRFFSKLVDLWVDKDSRCAVGVAVATHHSGVPSRCFSTMGRYFPFLDSDWQLEGLVAGLGDFSQFCREVRSRMWIAL